MFKDCNSESHLLNRHIKKSLPFSSNLFQHQLAMYAKGKKTLQSFKKFMENVHYKKRHPRISRFLHQNKVLNAIYLELFKVSWWF